MLLHLQLFVIMSQLGIFLWRLALYMLSLINVFSTSIVIHKLYSFLFPMDYPHKGPVMRIAVLCYDVIMLKNKALFRYVCDICHHALISHDDVIKWKHFPRYWPFVRGNHRSSVNSPHKGQWRGALVFSLICALNKRLSKQWWGWWFETPLRSL